MNIYEDEAVERKLDELSDQVGYLVLELLVLSLKKVVREQGIFSEVMDDKLGASHSKEPF
jgi:hypothetical protein